MNRHYQKKMGILPEEKINNNMIKFSFNLIKGEEADEDEKDEIDPQASLSKLIILNREGKFYLTWQIVYIFACLFSAYFYGFIACKADVNEATGLIQFGLCLEIFFFVTMGLEFITSFENPRVRGNMIKDLKTIAIRYLKVNFLRDFIPIIPL